MTLIDTNTAALILRMGARQVRNLVHVGKLTNQGTARRIKLDLEDVEEYADHSRPAIPAWVRRDMHALARQILDTPNPWDSPT